MVRQIPGDASGGSKIEQQEVDIESNLKVGGVPFKGATKAEEQGGMSAPSKRTEDGFSWTTKVRAEPRSASFQAWAHMDRIGAIQSLRASTEPVSVAFDFVTMGTCKVDDVRISHQSQYPEHVEVSIKVTEIVTPETGTAIVRVQSGGGSGNDGSTKSSGPELSEPTLARPEEQNTSGGPDGDGNNATGDVMDWMGF